MARISKLALFWRAFLVSLIVGAPATSNRAHASDVGDWASAVEQGTFESYVWYLKRNPTGAHIEEALDKIVTLTHGEAPKPGVGAAAAVAAASSAASTADNSASLY